MKSVIKGVTKLISEPESALEPEWEPEPKLFESRSRSRNKKFWLHNTGVTRIRRLKFSSYREDAKCVFHFRKNLAFADDTWNEIVRILIIYRTENFRILIFCGIKLFIFREYTKIRISQRIFRWLIKSSDGFLWQNQFKTKNLMQVYLQVQCGSLRFQHRRSQKLSSIFTIGNLPYEYLQII